MASSLREHDVKEYLIRIYFGTYLGAANLALERAYLDLSRTQRGFGAHPERSAVRKDTRTYLREQLANLGSERFGSQAEFDAWHESTCDELKTLYQGFQFTVGQAQKWINMTIKYLFVIDREAVEVNWQYCHVPIDKILLRQLRRQGHQPPTFEVRWSRLEDYADYLAFQDWFRSEFDGAPMDNEFSLWMRSESSPN